MRAAQPSSKMSSWALCISARLLAVMVFHQPRWKGNNNCILSASADETCLVYTRRYAAMKKGGAVKDVVCHSICDIAVIKQFLRL